MIEKDGTYNYSKVVVLHFGDVKNAQALIVPNPVKTNINLQLKGMPTGTYRIEITNTIGQSQFTNRINVTLNNQTETIFSPSTMNKGIYYLSIYDDKTTE